VDDILTRVRNAKKKVDALRQQRAEVEGQRKQIIASMKAEFGVDTIEAATAKLQQMDAEYTAKDKELQAQVADLESQLGAAGCQV
jgi:predicted transcriptional regulator